MAFKGLTVRHPRSGARGTSRALTCCMRTVSGLAMLLLLTLLAAMPALANENKVLKIATLSEKTGKLVLAPYTLVQSDPDNKISTHSILSSNGTILTGNMPKDNMVDLGYSGTPFWLTIRVQNNAQAKNWIVDLGRRSEGRLGYIKKAQAYEMSFTTAGQLFMQEVTPVSDKGVFAFDIPSGTQKYILLHIVPAAGKHTVLPLTLYNGESYFSYVSSYLTPFVIHALILLVYAAIFLTSAITRREPSLYLFFSFFLYEFCIWYVAENIGARVGFNKMDIIIPLMMMGYTLFSIVLAKSFFRLEYGSVSERYVLYGLAWINIIAITLSSLLPVSGGLAQIFLLYGAPFLTFTVICLIASTQSISGDLSKRYYFIGTIFPVLALFAIAAGFFGIIGYNAFMVNALWYSVAVQGLFMVIANHHKFSLPQQFTPSVSIDKGEVDFSRLRETRDSADHSRLLKVIEKEREILAEFRARENERVNEMRRAKEEADEANRAKSAFLAVVSHEIRTPMTGVMGMVRMLLDSSITKQQRDYVLTIQESSEAMMALLNDILDFERIQRGKIELENISFDLHRLIHGVITLMSGHAVEKGLSLSARLDDDLPKYVKGDPTRLRQVLLNLMGNAIKFTKTGDVTLFVRDMSDGEHKSAGNGNTFMIYFAIQDSGIGISDEARKNLFTPFAQADSTISRKFGGTGLGLAISKGLVETMGSAINISSKEGEGSTFFFTLCMPRGIASSASDKMQPVQQENTPATSVKPLRILVVDDNAITRKVIVGFLEQDKHDILTVDTAEAALEKIDQDAFDLVFMDIELPGMRGNEATKKLREHRDRVKAVIPVFAVTGNIAKEDRERYMADGMSGFVAKPIEAEQLRFIAHEIANNAFEREIRMPQAVAPDPFAMSREDFEEQARKAEEQPVDKTVFNPDVLQSLKDTIGPKQLGDLLTDLIVKTEEILQAMSDASIQRDLPSLAARAHELKGMAGNFGLVEISSIAAQAERKAKNADTVDLELLIGSLPDANVRAQSALKHWSSV